jgi:ABC-2 type transport system permease protein
LARVTPTPELRDPMPSGAGAGTAGNAPVPARGRPIKGPSALGSDWRRFVQLAVTLAVMDFKLRFFGSALGYFWQLIRPLMLFGVLYVVFTQFVRLGGGVDFYPALLLTGVVLFQFFAEATSRSLSSVTDREGLIRKIDFPRLAVPLAVILTAYFNLVINLIAVMVFVFATGVEPRPEWLAVPVLLLLLGLLAAGVGTLLAVLYVRFRDLKPIWDVVLQVAFYGSPILYPLEIIPSETAQEMIPIFNPLATILVQFRHSLIDPNAPTAWDAVGGAQYLLVPIAISAAVIGLGLWLFKRQAPRLAEEL